jgi:hypothetical protein
MFIISIPQRHSFSDTQSEKVGSSKNQREYCKRADKNQTENHEIESNLLMDRAKHEGDTLLFWDEFIKFTFFIDSSIHIRISCRYQST